MGEPNPYADDPYECLGIGPDASKIEVKVAAGKAMNRYNPDKVAPERKHEVRKKLYRIRDAKRAILDGEAFGDPPEPEPDAGSSGSDDGTPGPETGGRTRDPEPVSLTLEVVSSAPTVGEDVTVRVVEEDGEGVGDATVEFGDETKPTDEDGTATFTPESSGTTRITAEKESDEREYTDAALTIEIEERTRKLDVWVPEFAVAPSTTVELTVTDDDGHAVEDATVSTDGEELRTGSDGTVSVEYDAPGTYDVFAEKSGCEGDFEQVRVEKRTESLGITSDASTVRVGETVTFDVEGGGGPAVTVTFAGESKPVEGAGRVSFEPDAVGTFTARASVPDTDETEYEDATVSVDVEPIPLSIGAEDSTVPTDTPVQFAVVDEESRDPVDDVTVVTSAGDEASTTDGRVSFEFADSGEVEVRAGDDDDRYETAVGRITVEPAERELAIEAGVEAVEAGEPFTVTVRDSSGSRVENATVEMAGETWTTDERGRARVATSIADRHTVTARKRDGVTDYVPAETVVGVGDLEPLSLDANRTEITSGDSVRFTVRDDRTDGPVEGARVEAEHQYTNESTKRETDEGGSCVMTFDEGGRVDAKAYQVIDGVPEESNTLRVQVERTKRIDPESSGESILGDIDPEAAVGKVLMLATVAALVVGIGAIILQGFDGVWILGVSLGLAAVSVVGYMQIML